MVNENPRNFSPWPGEGSDQGVSGAGLHLARLLSEKGEIGEAEQWFRRIAELGDARSAAALRDLYNKSGDSLNADEWRQRAAELADANLSRNKRTLLSAYGESAVLIHVRIIRDYANYLAAQGDTQAADVWFLRASRYLNSGTL